MGLSEGQRPVKERDGVNDRWVEKDTVDVNDVQASSQVEVLIPIVLLIFFSKEVWERAV